MLSYAAVLGDFFLSYVLELAGGVLSCAAVPRVGLGPTTPPLCRYAEYTACQLQRLGRKYTAIWHLPVRSPGAWCEQRSGIKVEADGWGPAAELFTPSAMASTGLTLKAH